MNQGRMYVEKGKLTKDIFRVTDHIFFFFFFLPMRFNFKICLHTKVFYLKIILNIRIKMKQS